MVFIFFNPFAPARKETAQDQVFYVPATMRGELQKYIAQDQVFVVPATMRREL